MLQVGAFDAKNTLGSLLDRVENGEEVLITRHGKPVARLVRPQIEDRKTRSAEAIDGIRALARELNLGPFDFEEFKAARDEGRR